MCTSGTPAAAAARAGVRAPSAVPALAPPASRPAPPTAGPAAPVLAAAGEHDRVLDLRAGDRAVLPDRGVGPDVAVAQARAGPDDRGPAHGRALQARTSLDHDAPVGARGDQLTVDALDEIVEDEAVG